MDSSVNGLAAPTGQRLPEDGTIGCFAADRGVESGRGEARTGICVGVGDRERPTRRESRAMFWRRSEHTHGSRRPRRVAGASGQLASSAWCPRACHKFAVSARRLPDRDHSHAESLRPPLRDPVARLPPRLRHLLHAARRPRLEPHHLLPRVLLPLVGPRVLAVQMQGLCLVQILL